MPARRTLLRCCLPLLAAALTFPANALAQQDVSWETLAQVTLQKTDGTFVPDFGAPVQALEGKVVKLKGFMYPLEQAAQQRHFLLSANPTADCFFCMPGGPESLIEVKLARPVDFSYDPITISGTLEVLTDDPMGMYYRIADAKVEG